LGLAFVCFAFSSCKEGLFTEENEPSWLGSSVYEYLQKGGNYTNYLKLVDDLNYAEVLKLTGSKTIFVADDDAFDRFFKKNGISGYEQLSLAQKKLILNYGMVNDAYLMETFSNYYSSGLYEGLAIRRPSAISPLDSVAHEYNLQLPISSFWDKYRTKGIYLLRDNTNSPLVYFTQKNMELDAITNTDFKLFTGLDRDDNDVHLFKNKVVKRDITCKNGYVNVLTDVLLPPKNMAQFVKENQTTQTFSNLLDRFCAPYYDAGNTLLYKQLHPEFTDSIFTKRYFSKNGSAGYISTYPDGKTQINTQFLLPFDPGWNSYRSTVSNGLTPIESDMAAMFVPSDDAMNEYFNNGAGMVLKERYGSWDNVPNDILAILLRRHMRNSFVESVPSRFSKMIDSENSSLPVQGTDIVDNYVGVNGVVYITNKVYPPDDYASVYGPVLFSERTKVFNWAIIQNDFRLYLNSLISKYSFFVPTDAYFTKYIDPVAYGKDVPAALKYWYNTKTSMVNATIYKYNKSTNEIVGDSIGVLAPTTTSDNAYKFIVNRLLDLLDSHIVVGDVETGKGYYLTKGNNFIKVSGSGNGMTLKGGGDINFGTQSTVLTTYNQTNGKTYLIDKPVQAPLKSVYQILSETPEFSEFYALLNGFPSTSNSVIFVRKANYWGIDFDVKFFNTYNYTVYVPTNAAIQAAITQGLITPWVSQGTIKGINDMTDATTKAAAILKLERFLRYHFQDNSVFITGQPVDDTYQSATIKLDDVSSNFNTYKNKFYRLGVSGDGNGLSLTTEFTASDYSTNPPKVVTNAGLYNIMARDYVFSSDPKALSEVTVLGGSYNTSTISTSSTAVIHQISNVLRFQ
jgi:uncharacterized surface protein with fasciclin (FAS1) repeats